MKWQHKAPPEIGTHSEMIGYKNCQSQMKCNNYYFIKWITTYSGSTLRKYLPPMIKISMGTLIKSNSLSFSIKSLPKLTKDKLRLTKKFWQPSDQLILLLKEQPQNKAYSEC